MRVNGRRVKVPSPMTLARRTADEMGLKGEQRKLYLREARKMIAGMKGDA